MAASRMMAAAFVLLALAVAPSVQAAAETRVQIVNKPRAVAIGFADFDLLQARGKALKGAFVFKDAGGAQVAAYEVDYTLPVARSHVLFLKKVGAQYAAVAVKLTDGARTVFEQTLALPPVVETARVPTVDQAAVAEVGTANEPVPAALRTLKLPDYAKVADATLGRAERVVTADEIYKQVRCEINYPVPGSSDHGLLERQTTQPDDLARQSIYISLRSPLYDPKTGAFLKYEKYLVELMMEKDWLLPALQGEGDVDVAAPPAYVRVHSTAETVPSRHFLGNVSITGDQSGGLMQVQNTVTKDDDGNLYFAVDYRGVSRFNIHTRTWESTPVDIWSGAGETVSGPNFDKYHPFIEAILPKLADIPYGKDKPYGPKVVSRRYDDGLCLAYYHDGRIYLTFPRNAVFKGGTTLYLAMLMSIPTKHWDNAEAFLKEVKVHAVSWPTGKFPLWDTWVKEGEMDRKLHRTSVDPDGKRLYLLDYFSKYLWALDLDDEGNTRRLARLDTFAGKPIEKFPRYPDFLVDAAGHSLGAAVTIQLQGEEKPREVFLPIDGVALTDAIPKAARRYPWGHKHIRDIGGETQYGTKTLSKGLVASWLGWRGEGIKGGSVTIHYDAIAAMRAEGDRHRHILDRISGVSLAPIYYLASIPCEPGRVIGISDRGYDQAYYDTATADKGYVTKTPVLRDVPGVETTLAAGTVIGPYAHQWRREGDKLYLYYVGYHNGIARMLYAVDGKPLGRYNVEQLARRLPRTSADGAEPGKIMRMRHLNCGLDGRMLFTGTDWANRGGTPYSGGLVYFDVNKLDARYRLSKMSRAYDSGQMAWRVVLGEDGKPAQEIYLGGSFDKEYAAMLPPELLPATKGPKLFVYEDSAPKGVRDRFALDLLPTALEGAGAFRSVAFSRDQLFLLALYGRGKDTYLASIDITTGAFADVRRVANGVVGFIRPETVFITTPDERVMVYAWDDGEAASATFTEVVTAADGRLSFRPYLTVTGKDRKELRGNAPMGFVADPAGDGSYDLMIGSEGATGGEPETRLRLIKDFIAPRP